MLGLIENGKLLILEKKTKNVKDADRRKTEDVFETVVLFSLLE